MITVPWPVIPAMIVLGAALENALTLWKGAPAQAASLWLDALFILTVLAAGYWKYMRVR